MRDNDFGNDIKNVKQSDVLYMFLDQSRVIDIVRLYNIAGDPWNWTPCAIVFVGTMSNSRFKTPKTRVHDFGTNIKDEKVSRCSSINSCNQHTTRDDSIDGMKTKSLVSTSTLTLAGR